MITPEERELWMARRRALLLELQAIEKALCLNRVTVTMERKEAVRLGLVVNSPQM